MGNYDIDISFIEQNKDRIIRGIPVNVHIRDNENFSWKWVKALISSSPEQGGETIEVAHSTTSFDRTGEKWYIRILEEIAD